MDTNSADNTAAAVNINNTHNTAHAAFPAASAPRLSLCMIVRNECANLPACLDSVRGLADDLVVVDTGSTDGTQELARARGARVLQTTWENDFSRARNLGVAEARGAWILVLDADETLPAASAAALRAIVAKPADHACNLVQKNVLGAGQAHVSVHIVRLFPRRADVRFERPIHEQVNTSLERAGIPIVDTTIAFDHTGYAAAPVLAGKTERNRRIIVDALARDPDGDPNLRFFYASSFFDTKDHERAALEFEECARRSHERRKRLEAAALLKAAQAWFLTGRHDRAAALLPAQPAADVHPLAAHLRAELAVQAADPAAVRVWSEAVLAAPDVAYVPPEPLSPLKFKALLALANDWAARGRKDVAIAVLRLAKEISAGTRDGASGGLHRAYLALIR